MNTKPVNIEHQKLQLIQEFLAINSSELISKINTFLQKEKKKINTHVKPMSLDAFNQMIEQSEQDLSQGKVIGTEDMKKIASKWK